MDHLMLVKNLWIVKAVISPPPIRDRRDHYQVGILGLIRALESYDPGKGSLYGYARYWIVAYLQMWRRQMFPAARITSKCRLDDPFVQMAMRPLDVDGEVDGKLFDAESEETPIDEQLDRGRNMARMLDAIQHLPTRERTIVEARLRGETLESAGEELGVCRERCRQLEARAIKYLKERVGPDRVSSKDAVDMKIVETKRRRHFNRWSGTWEISIADLFVGAKVKR